MATPVTAPMVGKIVRLVANVGDHVEEDDPILVMEAMKMEIEIVASATGTLTSIEVAPGDSVTPDTLLANIE
ncbi:MAG TPA: acetyl-CoA carboxylase biotin carboxyl carrier protein subunit [Chloroflexota bacterium]